MVVLLVAIQIGKAQQLRVNYVAIISINIFVEVIHIHVRI